MQKLDKSALREKILAQVMGVPEPEEELARQTVALMKRGAVAYAELLTFYLMEMERSHEDPQAGAQNLAAFTANALFSVCETVQDAEPVAQDEMDAPHQMIHLVSDVIYNNLHQSYYAKHEGSEEAEAKTIFAGAFKVPMTEVGDA